MTQPFIDCAIRAGRDRCAGHRRHRRSSATSRRGPCIGSGSRSRRSTVPRRSYAAKFSTPFCMAVGFTDRKAGFAQFTEQRVHDAAVLELASKIRYRINPDDEYPRNFTGHLRATLRDGSEREFRQPYMRGGAHAPLTIAGTGDEVHGQRALRRLERGDRRPIAPPVAGSSSASREWDRWPSSGHERGYALAGASPSSPAARATSAAPSRWNWRRRAPR